jgi:hypothetical protein
VPGRFDDFPRTLEQFDRRFPSEEACRELLFTVRWPDGFVCPRCQGQASWLLKRGLVECKSCGHQSSLTAGTVLHGTRKPLRMWFRAMWWVCTQKTGGSAKGLQRLLGLGSYETAWTWLHKLRGAMVRADRDQLVGPVEVDDAVIGGREEQAPGRTLLNKAAIVVAVEIPRKGYRKMGRIRMRHVPDFSAASLVSFICDNVSEGSHVITDGWHGYWPLRKKHYSHQQHKGSNEKLPHVHLVVSLLKRWLLGTHQGAVRPKQLQAYLEEFTFRFNRRKSRHVGKLFCRMLEGSADAQPTPYRTIADRSECRDHHTQDVGGT